VLNGTAEGTLLNALAMRPGPNLHAQGGFLNRKPAAEETMTRDARERETDSLGDFAGVPANDKALS